MHVKRHQKGCLLQAEERGFRGKPSYQYLGLQASKTVRKLMFFKTSS
jgi:hypothetical protein